MKLENFQYWIKLKGKIFFLLLLFLQGLHCGSDCDPIVVEFWVVRVFCVSLIHGRFLYSHCFIV